MIDEERDSSLESLFRNKLEGSEIAAGGELEEQFMRRLGRREFMRFNPGRFNVFYLASIAAAAATITTMVVLSHSPERQQDKVDTTIIPAATITAPTEIKQQTETTSQEQLTSLKHINNEESSPAKPAKELPLQNRNKNTDIQSVRTDAGNRVVNSKLAGTGKSGSGSEVLSFNYEASATSGCVPLHITFHSTTDDSYKTEWNFGDGGRSESREVDYIYDLPGVYDVSLTVTNPAGRKAVATMRIDVWPTPKASFEIPQSDMSVTDDHIRFSNLSNGATSYRWDFGDGTMSEAFEPVHKYSSFGRYDVTLVAVSENGCKDSVSFADAFTDSGLFMRFPNAFTPNTGGPTGGYYSQKSDANNQVFHPVSSGVVTYNLKVYSKQGLLVFESDDLMKGWDGYYKGNLCNPGVYVWKVRGTYRNGSQIVMSGDVTLLSY